MTYAVEQLDPQRTALLVVDMQNDFLLEGAAIESSTGRAMIPLLREVIDAARGAGMLVIFTMHVHRADGSDLGRYGDLFPVIDDGEALVAESEGAAVHPDLRPEPGDIVIPKHRYSAFHSTDLDLILRGRQIDTVVITGVTSECCCHATARDAMFNDYHVLFLSDATASVDYPDTGSGAMSAAEVHRATLVVLGSSTAHVAPAAHFLSLL